MNLLRAYAAVMIVVFHAHSISRSIAASYGSTIFAAPLWWYSVVDLFFVMSGFLMVHMSRKLYGSWQGARAFAAKRAARTPPLYWIYTVITAIIFLGVANPLKVERITTLRIITSFLFYPIEGGPIIPLGWTLNAEMFFYALFALTIPFGFPRGPWVACAALAVIVALGRLVHFDVFALRFWSDPIFADFIWGIMLAIVYHRGIRLPALMGYVLILLSAVPLCFVSQSFGYGDMTRPFTFGLSAALLVAAATLRDRNWNLGRIEKAVDTLAISAYSLYLTHIITLKAVELVYRKSGLASSIGPVFYIGL